MQPGAEADHHLPSLAELSPQGSLDLTANSQCNHWPTWSSPTTTCHRSRQKRWRLRDRYNSPAKVGWCQEDSRGQRLGSQAWRGNHVAPQQRMGPRLRIRCGVQEARGSECRIETSRWRCGWQQSSTVTGSRGVRACHEAPMCIWMDAAFADRRTWGCHHPRLGFVASFCLCG